MAASILNTMGTHPVLCFAVLLALIILSIAFFWHLIDKAFRKIIAGPLPFLTRSPESSSKHPDIAKKPFGVYAAVGLLAGLAALAVFYWIASEVVDREAIVRFDHLLTETIRRNATSSEIRIFWIITMFGSFYVLAPTTIGVGILLLVLHRRVSLIGWIMAAFGGVILNEGLKLIFERPRPKPLLLFPHRLISWSFPSGHAMDSLIIYGMLTYLLFPLTKGRRRKALVLTCIAVIVSIGFSRLFLGVHYFSDIIAGYAAGLFWLNLCIVATQILRHANSSASSGGS
jgi:membrane-associated phospholipid phosphatase